MPKKVAILLNSSWNIVNFRAGLLKALHEHGHELVALSPADSYSAQLARLHCRHAAIPMKATGLNPVADARLLLKLWHTLKRERPDIILSYTIKPNIYGSLAGRLLGIPVVANVAGLGAGFSRSSWLKYIVTKLFRLALGCSPMVFFQNEEDRTLFIQLGIARAQASARLPGSGIDLRRFHPRPQATEAAREQVPPVTFILIARLLKDKGIHDYVAAARYMRVAHPGTRFQIVGFTDERNPDSVTDAELNEWVTEGVIEYLGRSDDVRIPLAHADCMVLPSYYREGVPRVLLEAAAMGLPIITCDTVGCRDALDDGVSGWLCEPRNPVQLAQCMSNFIVMSPTARRAMGMAGRAKMEKEFDESIVIGQYLQAITRFAR